MNVCAKFHGKPWRRYWDISVDKYTFWPAGGTTWKVCGSLKSVGFALWGSQMSVQNLMTIHLIVVEIFQCGPDRLTPATELVWLIKIMVHFDLFVLYSQHFLALGPPRFLWKVLYFVKSWFVKGFIYIMSSISDASWFWICSTQNLALLRRHTVHIMFITACSHLCSVAHKASGQYTTWGTEVHFVKSIYRERAVIQYVLRFAKCIHPGHWLSCFHLHSDIFPHEVDVWWPKKNPPDRKVIAKILWISCPLHIWWISPFY